MGKLGLLAAIIGAVGLGGLGNVHAESNKDEKRKQATQVSPLEFGSPVQFVSPLEFMAPAAYATPYGMVATPLFPIKKKTTYEKFVDLMPWKNSQTSFVEWLPWYDDKMKTPDRMQSGLVPMQKKK
jgi:hypothetical protein